MQPPITRELAELWQNRSWRSWRALPRFAARIIREERGNELVFNALREARYAGLPGYEERGATCLDRAELDHFGDLIAARLALLGYQRLPAFSSDEEDKCLLVGNRLLCRTENELRLYDLQRNRLRTVGVDGRLGNVVQVADRLYYFVEGHLWSLTADGHVQRESLVLSSAESTVLDQGMAVDSRGSLVVAEYKHDALGRSGAYVYVRRAGDGRWETVDALARRVDKHCHMVVFDPRANLFLITCGDSRKMLATLNISGVRLAFEVVSAGAAKTGGYLCAAPFGDGFVCGTDYTGGTNFLVFVVAGTIQKKEVLCGRFRRSVVTAIDNIGDHLLFAAWNMGQVPNCRNGLLLRSPLETKPLCYSEDAELVFDLFASADGLVVRAGLSDHHAYAVFRRR